MTHVPSVVVIVVVVVVFYSLACTMQDVVAATLESPILFKTEYPQTGINMMTSSSNPLT